MRGFFHGFTKPSKRLRILLHRNKHEDTIPPMRGCSNKQPKAISTNAGLLAPIVSSISSKDGFSPSLTAWGFFAHGFGRNGNPASPRPAPTETAPGANRPHWDVCPARLLGGVILSPMR